MEIEIKQIMGETSNLSVFSSYYFAFYFRSKIDIRKISNALDGRLFIYIFCG